MANLAFTEAQDQDFFNNDYLQAYLRNIIKLEKRILKKVDDSKEITLNQLIKLKMYYQDQLLKTDDVKYFNLINELENKILEHY